MECERHRYQAFRDLDEYVRVVGIPSGTCDGAARAAAAATRNSAQSVCMISKCRVRRPNIKKTSQVVEPSEALRRPSVILIHNLGQRRHTFVQSAFTSSFHNISQTWDPLLNRRSKSRPMGSTLDQWMLLLVSGSLI